MQENPDIDLETVEDEVYRCKLREVMIAMMQFDIKQAYQELITESPKFQALKAEVLPVIRQCLLTKSRVIIANVHDELVANGGL